MSASADAAYQHAATSTPRILRRTGMTGKAMNQTNNSFPHHATRAAIAAIALAAAALTGCHMEGGPGWSADRYTYVSTEWQPKTVTITDTRTGAEIWAVDVPVGQQLVVGFSRGTGPNSEFPDEVVWSLMPARQSSGTQDSRQPVPAAGVRRLEMKLRPGPERVGDELPGNPFDRGRDAPVDGSTNRRGASGG